MDNAVCVYAGELLQRYNFGEDHPFGPRRHGRFVNELEQRSLEHRVQLAQPVIAKQANIEWFHTHDYVERVKALSVSGNGFLDYGDTPAFRGAYEAAATVVGTVLSALDGVVEGRCRRAFIPIAGLHHARRDSAAGFCIFNDCGVAIEYLRRAHGIRRIAYVDIDAHHGDGVFYGFEDDPDLIFADLHEDGHFLYPGTGFAEETGTGPAAGTKLNIPMPVGAGDREFLRAWDDAEQFIRNSAPELILFQCGADSLANDPITHLQYSEAAHYHAATRLCTIADTFCEGRRVAMGGGGYNLENLAQAWTRVVQALVEASEPEQPTAGAD